MEAKAIAKSVRISPRKGRLVADLIRGKSIGTALAILYNVESTVKESILKVVNSAVANAENNHDMDVEKLYIKEIYIIRSHFETFPRVQRQWQSYLEKN